MKDLKLPFGKDKTKSDVIPQVPYTVFNFRAAEAASESKFRVVNQVIAVLVILGVATAGILGLQASNDARSSRDAVEEAFIGRTAAQQQLRELTGGADDLPTHIAGRRNQLGAALSTDTDIGTLVSAVLSTAPAGVEVTDIEMAGVVTSQTPAGAPTAPKITDDGAKAAEPPVVPRTVIISATAPDFDAPIVWRNTLTGLGYLTELVVDPSSGSQGEVTLSISATISAGELQSRRVATAAEVGSLSTITPAPDGKTQKKKGGS